MNLLELFFRSGVDLQKNNKVGISLHLKKIKEKKKIIIKRCYNLSPNVLSYYLL